MSKYSIFLSYSHADTPTVRAIYEDLVARQFNVWVDFVDLDESANVDGQIRKAIANSPVFVLIMSTQSIVESWVKNEINIAERYRRLIVPLMIEAVAHPAALKCYRVFDAASNPYGYDEFLAQLRALLSPQFLKTRQRLFEQAESTYTNNETIHLAVPNTKAAVRLAHFIRRMLDTLDPPISNTPMENYLADKMDITIPFADSLLRGNFPIQELDDGFLTDLAQVLHTSIDELYSVIASTGDDRKNAATAPNLDAKPAQPRKAASSKTTPSMNQPKNKHEESPTS